MLKDNPMMKKLVATGEERIGKLVQQLMSNEKFISGIQTIVSRGLSAKGTLDKSIRTALSAMNLPSTADLETLRQFVASPAAATLLDVLWAPGFLIVLLVLHPAFAAYGAGVAVLLALLKLGGDLTSKAGLTAANQAATEAGLAYGQALRAAETVTALGMLPALLARYRQGEAAMFALARPALGRAQILSAAGRALKLAATAGMIALGAWLGWPGAAPARRRASSKIAGSSPASTSLMRAGPIGSADTKHKASTAP
jgi:ABC-type protease/lipase transport system fused ATPase/permease subunit